MTWRFWSLRTPLRRQIDPIECGAVCLGIVLESHGRFVDNASLRDAARVSRNGSDAQSIIEAAANYSLLGKAKKLLVSDLRHISTPAILFFDGCHFVVFEGMRCGRYYVNDPARGRYALDNHTFRRRFSNIAIEFRVGSDFVRDESNRALQQSSRGLIAPTQFLMIVLGLVGGTAYVMMAACTSLLFALDNDNQNEHSWYLALGLMTLLMLLAFVGLFVWTAIVRCALSMCRHHVMSLQRDVLTTPASFFESRPFLTFARVFSSAFDRSFVVVESRFARSFWGAFFFVLLLEVSLLSLPIGVAVIAASVAALCQVRLRAWRSPPSVVEDHENQLDLALKNAVAQGDAMRAMGQEELLTDGLIQREVNALRSEHRGFWHNIMTSPILMATLFLIFVSLTVEQSWQEGHLPLVKIFEIVLLSFGFIFAGHKVSQRNPIGHDESASLRLDIAMAKRPRIEERRSEIHPVLIKLERGDFTYPSAERPLFHDLNVEIYKHELVGVVGGSLAGVSTLFRLLAGFYPLTSGQIIHFTDRAQLLRVALINEDSDLFLGTLKDNITFFDHRISEHDVVWALKQAEAVDLFYDRPLGLIAPIFAQGKNLSLSEKKRLLLAQALAHKPDLLLLDDFFLALDHAISLKILDNLRATGAAVVFNSYQGAELAKSDRVIFVRHEASLMIERHEHFFLSDEHYRALTMPAQPEGGFL